MHTAKIARFIASAIVAGSLAASAADNSMVSHPAMAPPPAIVPFTLDGIAYKYQLPPGFCVPTLDYAMRAARTAESDASNVTNVTFNDCVAMARAGADLPSWGMVKTPRSMIGKDAGTRESFIAILKNQFADGTFERSMAQAGSGNDSVKALGTDAYGAYVGGTIEFQGHTFAAVWGITAVKHRVLAIYIYGPYVVQRDVERVRDMVRRSTQAFVTMNEAR